MRLKFFFLLFFLFSLQAGLAQQYNFINYSIEDGLVQSQVQSMCQDKEGYIWLGTLGGLSKWDGINFINFSVDDGLLNNGIYALLAHSSGAVYAGTKGGFNQFNGEQITSHKFKDEFNENYVRAIIEDKNDNIWFGLDNGWLIRFSEGKFYYINIEKGNIRNLYCDEENNIWVSARRGISVVDNQLHTEEYEVNINVSGLLIHNDTVWFSTYGDGIFYVHNGIRENLNTQDGLLGNYFRGLKKNSDGSIWFYAKNGLTRYFRGDIDQFSVNRGLSNDNIRCLMEDKQGALFIGTDGAGLFKYNGDRFISYTTKDGLENEGILSIVEDNEYNLWFSSNGGGVSLFKDEEIRNYGVLEGIMNNTVWSSIKDSKGNILFGTSDGISLFDGQKFIDLYKERANKIWALHEDKEENLWAGTVRGLLYIDVENDTIINYSNQYQINKNVKCILPIDDERLWFCSDNGIHQYSEDTKEFSWFSMNDGLPDNFIMSAVKDDNGIIWVGTTNGLAFFREGQFFKVDHSEISSAKFITFLKLDGDNNLWIGTNHGLFQLNIPESYDQISSSDFKYYSNLDGLRGLECNQNSVFIDHKNNLWFGTNNGLMKLNLNKRAKAGIQPDVRLKGVRLFFEDIDLSMFSDSSNQDTSQSSNATFKYNQNHLTFDYIGINHTNPLKVKYKFKLIGNDEDWSPVTNNTYVTYSNLGFGDYSFFLKASNDNINWTEPLRFDFSITPPVYFTWWFYLTCILFLVGLFWFIVNRRKAIMEAKRATQLIIDKSRMLSLEQQALNASMNRHFIFNSLNSIQYYINRQDKFSANKYLTNFAKLVRKNLDNSLENAIYIDEEIERIELYLQLEQMRFKDKFTYKIKLDKSIEPQSVKIPSMLLQPFIENSIWHGILPSNQTGNIFIDVKVRKDKLVIDIIDNGIGIEKSLALKRNKKQGHISKGMELTKTRVDLVSKISNKRCFVDGPKQIYDEHNNVKGTSVSITINY